MNFKASFNKLKIPKVWLHYAVGTFLLYAFFNYIMKVQFVKELNLMGIAVFFFAYVILDRISHGILELN